MSSSVAPFHEMLSQNLTITLITQMTKTIPINETFYLGFQSMKIVLKTMSCISTNENSHQNFMHHCNSHKIYHEVHNLNC